MFKNKFKVLVHNKKELFLTSFEVLNDKEASKLTGGCRSLTGCGVFSGHCGELRTCQRFDEVEMDS
nr:hypothetical protein [Flavobacterium sp. ASV13]